MKIKEFVMRKRVAFAAAAGAIVPVVASVPAFASGGGSDPDLSAVAITPEMLKPVVDGVTANIGVILPIGITLFGIFLGIFLIPKIIQKFTGGGSR